MRIIFFLLLSILWLHPISAAAQENNGAITLQSGIRITAPVKATVYIDQKEVGTTPYSAQMLPGRYTIRVAADNYNPFVRRVDIKESTISQLDADLELGGGSVEFQTNVPGSQVILDDQTLILPIRISTLPEGTHKWTIIATGHENTSGLLTFTKGKNIFIYRELESSKGKAAFYSSPEGATIFLDGKELGTTPLEIEDLDASEHSVSLRKNGYALIFRTMDTSRGNKGELKAALTKMGAKLVVKTGAGNAEVFIEETPVGKGNKVNVGRVEKGTYEIRILAEGQKPLESHIRIPSSGKVVYKANLIAENESGIPALTRRGTGGPNLIVLGSIGAGSLVAAATTILILQAGQPAPAPSGDTILALP